MKQYFRALDQKNHGSIGIEELEELFISVGLAQTRDEVKRLIDMVDEDHSGKIEFDEFLEMIQS
jgi:centrin-1